MFGLISAGISLAGLGMSAVQAVQEGRRMKKAQAKSNAALQGYKNITEQNAYAATKAADVSSYQEGKINENLSRTVDTLAQTGAEGAIGGTANALQAANDANLQATQAQGQANYERDLMVAGEQSRIGQDAARRQEEAAGYDIGQANTKFNDASAAKAAAISGMVGQLGSAVTSAAGDFDPATGKYKYGNNKSGGNFGGGGASGTF